MKLRPGLLVLVGTLALLVGVGWVLYDQDGAPPPKKRPQLIRSPAQNGEQLRAKMLKVSKKRSPVMLSSILEQDLQGALKRRNDDVRDCLNLVRLHGTPEDEHVDLSATFTTTEDGRFEVAVTPTNLSDVTFDRCINDVLQNVRVDRAEPDTVRLELPPADG